MAWYDTLNPFKGAQETPDAPASSDSYEPAETSVSEALQYYLQTGDYSVMNFFRIGAIGTTSAISFSAFFRAITLLSGSMAEMLSAPGTQVVNANREVQNSQKVRRVLALLRSHPHLVEDPIKFWEDVSIEYLITGNMLLKVNWDTEKPVPQPLHLSLGSTDFSKGNAYTSDGYPLSYDLSFFGERGSPIYASKRDVIHARWPRIGRGVKMGFASSPVYAMRPALKIGIQLDQHIAEWASNVQKKMHINYADTNPQVGEKLRESRLAGLFKYLRGNVPLVTSNASVQVLDDKIQTRSTIEMRNFQVEDVLRPYGIPAPYAGLNLTAWGSGIEALKRLYFIASVFPHSTRLFSAIRQVLLPPGNFFLMDTIAANRGDAASMQVLTNIMNGDNNAAPVGELNEIRHVIGLSAASPDLVEQRRLWEEKSNPPKEPEKEEEETKEEEEEETNENTSNAGPIRKPGTIPLLFQNLA